MHARTHHEHQPVATWRQASGFIKEEFGEWDFERICVYVSDQLGPGIPLHVYRYVWIETKQADKTDKEERYCKIGGTQTERQRFRQTSRQGIKQSDRQKDVERADASAWAA